MGFPTMCGSLITRFSYCAIFRRKADWTFFIDVLLSAKFWSFENNLPSNGKQGILLAALADSLGPSPADRVQTLPNDSLAQSHIPQIGAARVAHELWKRSRSGQVPESRGTSSGRLLWNFWKALPRIRVLSYITQTVAQIRRLGQNRGPAVLSSCT